ncbi:MAG: hypothetical protein IKG01_07915 [Lachnospiraceae bacterium]|nr:hypothetical protein [Lachnospiraceae bacterium]
MSEMLEKIERLASAKSITDPVLIGEITDRFLNIRYLDLSEQKDYETFVPFDISRGFDLSEWKVSECTLREILTFIAMEENSEWYDIPAEDRDYFTGYFPKSACDCFMLTKLLCDKRKKNAYVNSFMSIDFRAFMKYVTDKIIKSGVISDGDIYGKREAQAASIYFRTVEYIFTARRNGSRSHEFAADSGFLLGEVLKTASDKGMAGWLCGTMPLRGFADSVRKAYLITDSLFMDCIEKNLITMSGEEKKALLAKCGAERMPAGVEPVKTFSPETGFNTKGE